MNTIANIYRLSLLKPLTQFMSKRSGSSRMLQRRARFRFTAAKGLFLLYLLLVSLVAWTWCGTAEVLVDFGRELYVPWQLANGKALYKDIAYFNGPLSPHFNALVFRIFGDSVVTIVVTNTILLAMLVATMYTVLLRYFSAAAATAACSCMLVVFGVAHMTPQGNYNYITPYSHEMTHGLLLAFLMLALLGHRAKFKFWKWSLVGILWGLVFLGKAEIFLATAAMLFCSLLLPVLGNKLTLRQGLARLVTAGGFGLLPAYAFWLLLGQQTSAAEALMHVLGTWRYIFTSDVPSLFFYRAMAGMTHPLISILAVMRDCVAIGGVLFALYALERNIGGRGWLNPVAGLSLVFALFVSGFSAFVLHDRALFVLAVAISLRLSFLALRRRCDFVMYHHLACWAVFSVFILSKIALRPSLLVYGFALAMPVVVLAAAAAVDWLPKVMSRDGVGKRLRLALVVLLALDGTLILAKTVRYTHEKNHAIGSGADRLRCAKEQGVHLEASIDYLSKAMEPDDTLLVLPEGISLNYLLRRENNSPYVNFMQPELVMYGEANILAAFQRNPSDYVVLVTRPVADYGLSHFGQPGYGDKIMSWIRTNYAVEKQFGADPFEMSEFGVQILRLNRSDEQTKRTELHHGCECVGIGNAKPGLRQR